MKPIKSKTYLSYLFLLGPVLSIMGISARIVSGNWSPVALGLLIAGAVIIGLWLLFLGSLAPGFWGRRSTQAGTNALLATLSVLIILGLVNFLAARYPLRVDLTENQLFTLSPLSQQVVKNLQQPVKVWVFSPNPNTADRDLLANYSRYGSNLQFEFVDPQLKPAIAQKFNVQSVGQVFLEYGAERQPLQTVSDAERLSEIKLTNGIERITNARTDQVYFLQGHGERPLEQVEGGLSQAIKALAEENFTAQPLNLAERSEVPADASLIVIAGPKRKLFAQEVQALKNYLSSGGSLLVMLDPDADPGLNSLLNDWGVKLDGTIAIDASGQGRAVGLGPATPIVTSYGNHPITQAFNNGFSVYPLAQPIAVQPVQGVEETPLVQTSEQSWAESDPTKQPLQFDEGSDRPGPLTLGVALSRKAQPAAALPTPKPQPSASPSPSPTASPNQSPTPNTQASASPSPSPTASPSQSPTPNTQASPSPSPTASPGASPEASASPSPEASASPSGQPEASPFLANQKKADKKPSESRLVVYGNSNFATDGWFEQQLNSDVFLNSVSWLSKRDEQALSIRPKEPKNRRINLSEVQSGALGWTALLLMPLFGLTTAAVMWWRRR
ncbi:MAG: ABC transporter [Microcoleus sp. SIO2G3]|nr:ABC transporter [Microcoleus sp. SIO2G3]